MYPLEPNTATIGHRTSVNSLEIATVMAQHVARGSTPSPPPTSRKRSPPSNLEESELDYHIQATTPAPTYGEYNKSSSETSIQQQRTPLQTSLSTGSSSCSEDMGSSSSPDILAGGSTGRSFRFGELGNPFHGPMSTTGARNKHEAASLTARAAQSLNATALDAGPSLNLSPGDMRGGDEGDRDRVLSGSPGHCSTTSEDFSVPGHDDTSRSRKGKKRRRTNLRGASSSSAREGDAATHKTTTAASTPLSSSSSYANQSHFYPRPPGRRPEEGEGHARNRRAGAGADEPVEPDVASVAATSSSTSPFSLGGPTQGPSEQHLMPPSSSSTARLSVSRASSTRRTMSSAQSTTQSTTPMSVESVEVLDLSRAPSMEVIDVDDDADNEDGTRTVLSPMRRKHPLRVAAREGGGGVQGRGRGSTNDASSSSGVEIVSSGRSSTAQPQRDMGGAAAGRRSLSPRAVTSAEDFAAAIHMPCRARAGILSPAELDGNTGDDEAVIISSSRATRRQRARDDDGERLVANIHNQESRFQEQSDAEIARQLQLEEDRHMSAVGDWRNLIAGAIGAPIVDVDWLGGGSGYADLGDSSEQEEEDVEEVDHVYNHAVGSHATVGTISGGHGAGATPSTSSQGHGNNSRGEAAGAEGDVISVGAGEGRRNSSVSTAGRGRGASRAVSSHAAITRESNSGAGRGEGASAGANRRGTSARRGRPAWRGAHSPTGAWGGGRSPPAEARRRRQHSRQNEARSEGQFAVMMSSVLASLEPFIGGIRGGGGGRGRGGRGSGGARGGQHGQVGGSAAHMALMNRNLTSADYPQLLALDEGVQGGHGNSGRKGLTDVELSMLPTQKGNGSGDMEQCCICMDDMKPRQSITRLPACLHTFHSKCISKWLKRQGTCPMDKARVNVSGS